MATIYMFETLSNSKISKNDIIKSVTVNTMKCNYKVIITTDIVILSPKMI